MTLSSYTSFFRTFLDLLLLLGYLILSLQNKIWDFFIFFYISQQQRNRSFNLICSHLKIGCTQSTSPGSDCWIRVPPNDPWCLHRTRLASWRPRVCVCPPPHLRRAAARPGLPAGIYWLALCPAAGRLVRSVLTTSAPQRHLWTINSDTKAVGATAEPTHAANWCFSMPAHRGKLLQHHCLWGFSLPFTGGVICRAPALSRAKVRMQLHIKTKQANCECKINIWSCHVEEEEKSRRPCNC